MRKLATLIGVSVLWAGLAAADDLDRAARVGPACLEMTRHVQALAARLPKADLSERWLPTARREGDGTVTAIRLEPFAGFRRGACTNHFRYSFVVVSARTCLHEGKRKGTLSAHDVREYERVLAQAAENAAFEWERALGVPPNDDGGEAANCYDVLNLTSSFFEPRTPAPALRRARVP